MQRIVLFWLLNITLAAVALPAGAAPNPQPTPIPQAALECRQAVAMVERAAGVPPRLMAAIARIESGRADGQGGVHPWPWTINVEGAGYTYETKADAIAAVRAFQAKGARSIDVGCMQVNLMYHPAAFATLDEGFDPMANARYAAKFLTDLYAQTHDWAKATAQYHSATPALGSDYQRKVYAVLPDESRKALTMLAPAGPAGNVWSGNVWSQNVWNTGGAPPIIPRGPAVPATGGFQLTNRADQARVIPAPQGTAGRGLDAYRTAPVPIAARPMNQARL